MKRLFLTTLCAGGLLLLPALTQAPGLADLNGKLRAQETKDSQVMWWLHEVTDVYGPRLTGSPGLRAAQDFAVGTLTSWGFSNVHLEAWNFNHPGWQNWDLEANAISPFQQPLNVRAVSWTPGTNGMIQAPVVMVLPPMPPAAPAAAAAGGGRGGAAVDTAAMAQAGTSPPPMPPPVENTKPVMQADLDAYLASIKDKVHGAVVFVGPHVEVPEAWAPAPLRRPDETWAAPAAARGGRGAPAAAAPAAGRGGRGGAGDGGLSAAQINTQVNQFLVDNGALVKVTDAGRSYGVIVQQASSGYNENPNSPNLPTLLMGNEDYGRIARILTIDKIPVVLRVNIHNEFYPNGRTVYNVVGELPGTDKPDEVVMAGGHFDSWNPATGATDNAAGGAVAVEAARLLHTLGVKTHRTIRVALWSGEEEGLYGSLAYVAAHFGSAENPKPEWFKLDAYINQDGGTGKPRAASVFGPAEAAAQLQPVMDNFKDWGFNHVNPTLGRTTGGTDSTSFNNAGLPGIGLSQDGFDYGSYTHHTNFDTYERLFEPDLRESSVEEAMLLFAIADAPQMLPRCTAATMPPLPAGRGGGGGGGGGGRGNVPVTPVAPFAGPPLAAGATAPAAPTACTAGSPTQSASGSARQ